jgi:hypothetical protein
MNLKATLKYQVYEYKNNVIIYYAGLITFNIFILSMVMKDNNPGMISGMETVSIIFLLMTGMFSFKEGFHMLMQNGVSRITIFKGRLLSGIILSLGVAFADVILLQIGKWYSINYPIFNIHGLLEGIYNRPNISVSRLRMEGIFYNFSIYHAVFLFGCFLSVIYYRLSKGLKTLMMFGIPATLFIGIPILDANITNGNIGKSMKLFIQLVLGIKNNNPYIAMVNGLIGFLIFSILTWLVMEKTMLKN